MAIKRFIRIIFILFLALVHFIVLSALLFQSSTFQSYATNKAIDFLSNKYNLTVTIDNINVKLPAKIGFEGVHIQDISGDTLLYANNIYTKIADIKILDRKVYIDKLEFEKPYLNIYVDTLGVSNIDFLLELFSSNDTTESDGMDLFIFINKFDLKSARINYVNNNDSILDNGFDQSHISLSNIDLVFSDFQMYNDTIELNLEHFGLLDKSGLCINDLSAYIIYHPKGIELIDLYVRTPYSELLASQIQILGDDENYLEDPENKIKVDIKIDTCILGLNDLKYFLPDISNSNEKIYISGDIKGKMSDIKFKDFILDYGYKTHLEADLSVNGFPDLEYTFLFGDVNNMQVSVYDMERLLRIFTGGKDPKLPDNLYSIGLISFEGNIAGMYNDLVAYGEFTAPVGRVKTDISFSTDLNTGLLTYNGDISGYSIRVGKLMDDMQTYGDLSFDLKLNGSIDSLNNFSSNINLNVSELGLMGYNYNNIVIEGDVSNLMFNGSLIINDPNLNVEFLGKYDAQGEIPIVDFSASMSANLDEINIDTASDGEAKLLLIADFEGGTLQTAEGLIQVRNIMYRRNTDTVLVEELNISTGVERDTSFISIRSDVFDANLKGKYDIKGLQDAFSQILSYYLPAFSTYSTAYTDNNSNHFDFDLSLQSIDKFTNIFMPVLHIKDTIKINGGVYTDENKTFLNLHLPHLKYDSISASNIQANLLANNEHFKLDVFADSINTTKYNLAENTNFSLNALNDSIFLECSWNNFDSINYSGNIKLSAILEPVIRKGLPKIEFQIHPSYFMFANNKWDIDSSLIVVDSSDIAIDDFIIKYNEQSLRVDGFVSKDPKKLLRFYVQRVNLENINPLIKSSGYYLGGELTSSGRFASLYDNPIFKTSMSLNRFSINQENFGRFDITADWLETENGFRIMGSNYFLKFNGNYVPLNDSLNIDCDINNFNLEVFDPYLITQDITNTKGYIDGSININGALREPDITGFIDFERAQLTYDYLKLKAILNDTLIIKKDRLEFNDFVVTDEENHKGIINGGVYHNHFEDISFKFDIKTDSLKIMNTKEFDNNSFYGTAYATGDVTVSGDMSQFGISVDARTEPNTVFVLPMTDYYEAGDNSILTFVLPENYDTENIKSITSLKSPFEYFIDLNIELTPDAEALVVFDPKVGDMIKANCRGNINIYYDSDETFNITGEVEIVEGSYLFTLQNIINKKFEVVEGGSIVWSGDPYEAVLNLDAVYNVRAPLSDLMAGVDSSIIYSKMTNVECIIHMKESLMQPVVSFSINIPTADEKVKTQLASFTEEEINKQVLYLLIMNRFYTPEYMRSDASGGGAGIPVGMTASEWASNQVSNWLSQISKDFDVGIKYRPGDEVTPQEVEVALSTQLFNDRILIDGNVGLTGQQSEASNIVGNVDVQWKITKKGNLRIKGYNHANSEIEIDYGPYTQGVGLFYTEDFNTFGELLNKYWEIITFKKHRKKRRIKEIGNK